MKTIFTRFILFFAFLASYQLPAQNYTWMKGAPSASLAVYGTLGVTAPGNSPGGQSNGITWTDASGNLWMYGGQGFNNSNYGYLNDLWKYSPLTNNWTWVNGSGLLAQAPVYGTLGVSSPGNNPGGRQSSASWTDASGNLWLFGGLVNMNPCNDLWRYTIANNQWTWMGGSNTPSQTAVYGNITVSSILNIPGASYNFVSWKDPSGNFWLYDATDGTEIWKYNPSNAQWAWMSGTNVGTVTAVFGTLGVSSTSVHPDERWTEGVADASGNLYVFGGNVNTSTGTRGRNDLWKYTISNNQWTWISGTQMTNSSGSYGTQGVFSSTTVPLGRYGHVLWLDNTNKMWLFGGEYHNLTGTYWLNDTWCFDITTGQWAWMKGSNTPFANPAPVSGAVYGTQTIPAVGNTPGYRVAPPYWTGDPTTLWIFSGFEWTSSHELWKFNTCITSSTLNIGSSHTVLCAGSAATLTANGAVGSYSWSNGALTNTISVSPLSTTVYNVRETSMTNCSSPVEFTVVVPSLNISLSNPGSPVCSGHVYVLSAGSASSYSWSTGQNSQTISVVPTASTVYTLSAVSNGCAVTASYGLNVTQSPSISVSSSTNTLCAGQIVSLTASGASSYTWNSVNTGSVLLAGPLITTTYSVNGTTNGCSSSANYIQVVKPKPVLSISSSPSVSCSGSPVVLTAGGAVSYSWNTGQIAASLSLSPLTTSTYTLGGTTNGCSSSITYTQVVNPNPVLSISSSLSVSCSGSPLVLTAGGAVSYSWNTGQSAASLSLSPLTTSAYTLSGTTNGCSSSITYTQVVNPNPVLSISSSPSVSCSGSPVVLTVAGAGSYNWNTGQTTSSFTATPPSTTVYTVTGTTNGCSGTATYAQQVLALPTLTGSGPANVICNGQTATLSVTGANTYTWSGQGTNNPVILVNPAVSTSYTVTGADINGCKDETAITVNVTDCVGVQEYAGEIDFSVYPNPASGLFTIKGAEGHTLQIINSLGQLVLEQSLISNTTTIHSGLSNGVYYCKVSGVQKITKIVIEE